MTYTFCDQCTPADTGGLEITKEKLVLTDEVGVGEGFTWVITVTNTNDDPLTNVVVTDSLPADCVQYLSHTAGAGTYDETTGEWIIGDLAGTKSITLDINVAATALTEDCENTASAVADDAGPVEDTDSFEGVCAPFVVDYSSSSEISCETYDYTFTGSAMTSGGVSVPIDLTVSNLETGAIYGTGTLPLTATVPTFLSYEDNTNNVSSILVEGVAELGGCTMFVREVRSPDRTFTTCDGSIQADPDSNCSGDTNHTSETSNFGNLTVADPCSAKIQVRRVSGNNCPDYTGGIVYSTRTGALYESDSVPTNHTTVLEYFDTATSTWIVDTSASNGVEGRGTADKNGDGYQNGDLVRLTVSFDGGLCDGLTYTDSWNL